MARAMNGAASEGHTVELMAVELSSPVLNCQATLVAKDASPEAAVALLARSDAGGTHPLTSVLLPVCIDHLVSPHSAAPHMSNSVLHTLRAA